MRVARSHYTRLADGPPSRRVTGVGLPQFVGVPAHAGNRARPLSTVLLVVLACIPATARAATDLEECRDLLIRGRFEECIKTADAALEAKKYGEDWPAIKARAELQLGRYSDALATTKAGMERYSWSIRLRYLGSEAAQYSGNELEALTLLFEIDQLAGRSAWRYTDTEDLVVLGRAAIKLGTRSQGIQRTFFRREVDPDHLTKVDAREILETFYDKAKQYNPKHRDPILASGELALAKHDYALAAEIFRGGCEIYPEDPAMLFGLAEALADSDAKASSAALAKILEINPNHVPTLLQQVDRLIDAEDYDTADTRLKQVLAVNPKHPLAWAYRSLIAYFRNDSEQQQEHRATALSTWAENPEVDHLIGRKLSQHYRFRDGAEHQRRALAFDPDYVPARAQLAQDLLRLGEEKEGWKLADEAFQQDGYDVSTFNLVELHDKIQKFRTLESEHFIVRMDPREALIYGQRVIELLELAQSVLCEKYGHQLDGPVIVEIFDQPNDFAVRTFGMPAVSGYLGVCFGKVITANSPASQFDSPSNWESVLWHEFCHVVTLEQTRNRIPRWLSEGISVYEEIQANPAWGQQMNPEYRRMILAGELTPLAEMSSAFHAPPSGLHLQFAYYQSALAVEFIIDNYGLESVKLVLQDLGAGLPINTALDRRVAPLPKLQEEFVAFARQLAADLAPKADWSEQDFAAMLSDDGDPLTAWLEEHPNHFVGLTLQAQRLLADGALEEAEPVLKKLIDIYPEYVDEGNAYERLAELYRRRGDTQAEIDVLQQYVARQADDVRAGLRLVELHRADSNWSAVVEQVDRLLQVNPLTPQPYRAWAHAAEALGHIEQAAQAHRALLLMDPPDPAETHYRLAVALHKMGDAGAKRHVLTSLEEAPRFRAAHRLLLEIDKQQQD